MIVPGWTSSEERKGDANEISLEGVDLVSGRGAFVFRTEPQGDEPTTTDTYEPPEPSRMDEEQREDGKTSSEETQSMETRCRAMFNSRSEPRYDDTPQPATRPDHAHHKLRHQRSRLRIGKLRPSNDQVEPSEQPKLADETDTPTD